MRPIFLLFVAVLALSACGPLQYELVGDPVVIGADATLKADVHKDQNFTAVDFAARNLAPPARLGETLTTYVVWQRKSDQSDWERVGALDYDDKTRRGTLRATVPQVAFELEVTAEDDAQTRSPGGVVVFSQRVP